MQPEDLDLIADCVVRAVKSATDPLLARIAILEAREPIQGKDGAPGLNGKDADPVDVIAIAKAAAALIPIPANGLNGKDGANGKDAPLPDLDLIALKAAALIPKPKDGERGTDGKDGRDGTPAPAIDLDALALKASTLIPRPADGRDGRDGKDGKDGLNGKDGAAGLDGKDGKDGRDGLSFEDMTVAYDDATKELVYEFKRGDFIRSYRFFDPRPRYVGVHVEGTTYLKGDCVTRGGSVWHANITTANTPAEGNKDWTLCVRRGAEGKQGRMGEKGEPGKDHPLWWDKK